MNNNGQQITKSAIEWATGLGGLSAEIKRFGNETVFASTNGTLNIQYGSKATLTDKARLKSITAYVGGANDKVRFAIYSNKSGQPDKLLAESAIGSSTTAMAWVTLTVPPTDISPGDYWLAFTFNNSSHRYRYNSSGAGERNKSNSTAIANGYLQSWGTSTNSYTGTRSIYATYEVLP